MELESVDYTVELWDISGVFVADISNIISTSLRITISLNDVEDVAFSIDLVQFENLCAAIGATPRNLLDPYRTDVKIRRNGEYLCGAQVVRVQANFNNAGANTIEVQCTGYLNYFKDRYVSSSHTNKTYAEIAWDIIDETQSLTNGDFGVTLGVDEASADQSATRDRNYDLQEVKDGVLNLQKLEDDNFDHIFRADKTVSFYTRLGSDKPEVQLVYPRNVTSVSVVRDAVNLFNKIYGLGSGIGEERLQEVEIDATSALTYRLRERKELFNSVINQAELEANTIGVLERRKDMLEYPVLSVTPNELDLNNVGIGDAVTVRVENSTFIENIDGLFRIVTIQINWNVNGEENISLEVIPWE